ncbi:MAG TPA: iron export ABC transporter permease subunit FetB [bacterium]|nr:iron export ABC transporter permease subunit FetB [bacterium]HPO07452.1 iron export ABC transporter permease subunit FetB [bacterium]HQO33471.1 iron export ABC transporter permease subunit FetB [bacterium]HQP97020.1 iron export ABC transporter permease subunit FetB [bacterium]
MSLPFVDLGLDQIAIAFGFVVVTIGMSWLFGFGLERQFTVASIRVFIQLLVLGYVLKYIFALESHWALLFLVECMVLLAAVEAARRQEERSTGLVISLLISLNVAVTLVLLFLFGGVFQGDPLHLPHYFIPLAGMVIGNAANGAALAVHRLAADIRSHRGEIEAALALGASPQRAIQPYVRATVRTALIPSINTMMLTGLVQIPGIMGGMLMAGGAPMAAARYQMVIMYMLPCGVMGACLLTAFLFSRSYFSNREQLREM